jgi:glycosyltransferase involved in cell wall biosynthesis
VVVALSAAAFDVAWWLAVVTLSVGWSVALLNAFTFRRLVPGEASAPRSGVSILVPARDEEETLPRTLPRLLAQGADEVLVLDDGSRDATRAVVERLALHDARLRLVPGEPLAEGWSGKNWACHQLAREATGDVLLFTDADVTWSPGALSALLAVHAREDADLLTVWPRQRCVTLGERAVVPLVDMLLISTLPALLAPLPWPASLTGANGQCMLWRRAAYDAVGGHAAVQGEVLEDVRLAQLAKGAGRKVVLRLGGRMLETRMYRSYAEAVMGFGKNALAAAGGRRWALVALLAINLLTYTLSWPLALWVDARWWAVAIAGVLLRALTNGVSLRSPLEAVLQPIGALAFAPIVALSLRWAGAYEWRGRRYG